jgi:hypothetical protein
MQGPIPPGKVLLPIGSHINDQAASKTSPFRSLIPDSADSSSCGECAREDTIASTRFVNSSGGRETCIANRIAGFSRIRCAGILNYAKPSVAAEFRPDSISFLIVHLSVTPSRIRGKSLRLQSDAPAILMDDNWAALEPLCSLSHALFFDPPNDHETNGRSETTRLTSRLPCPKFREPICRAAVSLFPRLREPAIVATFHVKDA